MGEFSFVGTAVLQAKAMAAVKSAVAKSQADLEASAKPLARVDTGAERSGIHSEPLQVSGTSVTGRVSSSMEYDIYQHQGTRYITGTFFLQRPLIGLRTPFLAAMAAAASGEF